jgi:23S rRNA (adenine2503-C2)-methyltransferase
VAEQGQPAFRAGQILQWLYQRQVMDAEAMTNLPQALRRNLAEAFELRPLIKEAVEGPPEGTRKMLVRLPDGEAVEEVLIPAPRRKTVCVSSQVGCRFKCAFCASGQSGLFRSLESGEMVAQVLLAAQEYGERVSHVVFMGVGEPFDNYDEVLRAARRMNAPDGLGISARRITISTCGVLPGIEKLAREPEQFELSVSLHAAEEALRSRLLPVNRRYPLEALMRTCRAYTEETGRIITFEYTLVKGLNDTAQDADRLCRLLRPLACRVNLIPLSPVEGFAGLPPEPGTAEKFIQILEGEGINATLRRSKGCGVQAACGQLRASRS